MEQAMFPQNENNTPFDNEALFDAEGHLTDEGLHPSNETGPTAATKPRCGVFSQKGPQTLLGLGTGGRRKVA